MPTYDYKCNTCEETYEISHSIKEGSQRECPVCKQETLEKQITGGSGVIFKGSGFYETDYKRKGVKEDGGASCKDGKASSCACC